jgi:hypothetical protein
MCLIFGHEIKDLLNVLLPFEYRKGVRWDLDFRNGTAAEGGYGSGS